MLRFILRRLLFLIPALIILSWVAFGLSQCTPGDPVQRFLPQEELQLEADDVLYYEQLYKTTAAQMKRDLPVFYCSLTNGGSPGFLSEVALPQQRAWLNSWSKRYGNWPAVEAFYLALRELAINGEGALQTSAKELLLRETPERVELELAKLITATADTSVTPDGKNLVSAIQTAWVDLQANSNRAKLLLPQFHWHGTNNQYHLWLKGILRGDMGRSFLDRQSVSTKIWSALRWTLLINILAVLLAYGVAIPLGMRLGQHAGSRFDRYTNFLLFLLFSLPAFWVATMISNFFTTPVYGMDWFPSMGVGDTTAEMSWWSYLLIRAQHLFLPVLMLAYPSWAYLSRQMRAATIRELGQPYVQTARLKGLSWGQILRKHVLRNALFPIITLLASLLPALLAGSVLIELIFNIPGMGRLLIDATLTRDWPVVTTILLLTGLATILGLLLADILYRWADPRLRRSATTANRL